MKRSTVRRFWIYNLLQIFVTGGQITQMLAFEIIEVMEKMHDFNPMLYSYRTNIISFDGVDMTNKILLEFS